MDSQRDIVLLLSHTADHFTIDRVAAALMKRGTRPIRLNSDQFPSQIKISSELSRDKMHYSVRMDGVEISTDKVRAVWNRRIWTPNIDANLDPRFREACMRESMAALRGFLDGLHSCRWIDAPNRVAAAGDKLLQLRLARKHGLTVPRTLVTNDPAQVRSFSSQIGGNMIAKMLTALDSTMGPSPMFVYTSKVNADALGDLASLRHCPMVFQENITKACELRVAYVDGQVFVGRIDASATAAGQTDWRRGTAAECHWQRDTLPPPCIASITAMMQELGLSYGGFDFIRTPAGEHVFLEVNPTGEWGMLERDLGLPISEAIADALLNPNGNPT